MIGVRCGSCVRRRERSRHRGRERGNHRQGTVVGRGAVLVGTAASQCAHDSAVVGAARQGSPGGAVVCRYRRRHRSRLWAGETSRRLFRGRASPGAVRRARRAAHGFAGARPGRSPIHSHARARVRSQGPEVRDRAVRECAPGAVLARPQGAHRRLVQLGAGSAGDRDDEPRAADGGARGGRVGRPRGTAAAPPRPARPQACQQRAAGAAACVRGSADRLAEPQSILRAARSRAGEALRQRTARLCHDRSRSL